MAKDQHGKGTAPVAKTGRSRWRATLAALALGLTGAATTSCGIERPAIDLRQPNGLTKSFFLGPNLADNTDNPEFYMNNFVVASPADQSLVAVGSYDEVDRVVWEVQEGYLIARKAYEYVTGRDGYGARPRQPGDPLSGIIVAAYRISSHFDVRYDYDPSTGQRLNRIIEAQDRPWYDREYMRVDWSQNIVDNPGWGELFYGSVFGDLSFQPLRYEITNPSDPDAPNFREMDTGYFDVTSHWTVNPEMSNFFGGEPLPTCLVYNFFTGSETFSCSPQETTIRTSFRRVDPTREFEPLELTVQPYDLVGTPTATRADYTDGYGENDANFHRYAMIHNLWDRSHFDVSDSTVSGTVNAALACSTDADCNAHFPAWSAGLMHCASNVCQARTAAESNFSPLTRTVGARTYLRCTSNDDTDANGTADQCSVLGSLPNNIGNGSQCDTVSERCTIPYIQRTIRPLAYYENDITPAQMHNHCFTDNPDGTRTYVSVGEAGCTNTSGNFERGSSEQLIDTWDASIYLATAHAREVECRRTNQGDRNACHARFFSSTPGNLANYRSMEDGAFLAETPIRAATEQRAVALCHNPIQDSDNYTYGAGANGAAAPRACRETGFQYRQGDIRYNHLTYWPVESRAPWGGIAHWGYDPLTGQVVANGATNMGRSVNFAATLQRDIIRLILSQIDCGGGHMCDTVNVSDYVGGAPAAQLVQHIRNPAFAFGTNRRISDQELSQRVGAIDLDHALQNTALNVRNFGSNIPGGSRSRAQLEVTAPRTAVPYANEATVAVQQRAASLQGTPAETALLDQNQLIGAGMDPDAGFTADTINQISPLRQGDPVWRGAMRQAIETRLEARGYCLFDADAPPMIGSLDLQGVARWYLAQYRTLDPQVRAQRILQDLQTEAYKGIALHELGHSLGLLHLPVSSYDSMNYNPQYWQLRAHNSRVASDVTDGVAATCRPACTPGAPNCPSIRNADVQSDNCMGPRYLDPATNEELGLTDPSMPATAHHAAIDYFANTSTMEYQFERFDETIGLGSYDMQAMGLLYGRVVETMDRAQMPTGADGQDRFGFRLVSQLSDQDRINWADPSLTTADQPFLAPIHYTDLARQLSVFDPATQCRPATAAEQDRYKWRLINNQICTHIAHDYAAMADMVDDLAVPDLDFSMSRAAHVRTSSNAGYNDRIGSGELRWHYRVAWDRGTGYPHINYFDQGADIYEVSQSMMRKYDLSYATQYFRRGNREFAWWSIGDRVAGYFNRLRGYHWSVANDIVYYGSLFNRTTWNQVAASDAYMRDYLVTGTSIFDFFQRVMLTPQPGTFQRDTTHTEPELTAQNLAMFDAQDNGATNPSPATDFNVGIVRGRYVDSVYDQFRGGSLDYWHWLERYGSSEEKINMSVALADVRPTFQSITRDLYLDARRFYVNFNTDMPQAFSRLIGGILSEDWAAVAPHVDRQETNVAMDATGLSELTPLYPRLWSASYVTPSATDPGVQRFSADGTTVITDPNRAPVIFPNIGVKQQLGLSIYAMLFTGLNTDNTTINQMRIYVPGGVEQVNFPDAEQVRFTNPETGITYVARSFGADAGYGTTIVGTRTVDRGIGSRILQHANALGRRAYQTTGSNPDGTPIYARNAQGQLMPLASAMQTNTNQIAFHNYVGFIDQVRNVARILGYGQIYDIN